MKLIFTILLSLSLLSLAAQQENENTLKQYMFVMYSKGPTRTHDSVTSAQIQVNHQKHLDSLAALGVLIVAGPFAGDNDWRGILIFDVATKEQAEAYVKKDPAVLAGRLSYTIIPWFTQKGVCFK
ncbi:MAG TPA: YciI family protein [Bacteroidia bacterium]|nr:YciI family protein [Bacteroidia bacterium]